MSCKECGTKLVSWNDTLGTVHYCETCNSIVEAPAETAPKGMTIKVNGYWYKDSETADEIAHLG